MAFGDDLVAVYTHRDMPRLTSIGFPYPKGFIPMQDTRIHHNGQPVHVVEISTGLWDPAQQYALIDSALRAAEGRSLVAAQRRFLAGFFDRHLS